MRNSLLWSQLIVRQPTLIVVEFLSNSLLWLHLSVEPILITGDCLSNSPLWSQLMVKQPTLIVVECLSDSLLWLQLTAFETAYFDRCWVFAKQPILITVDCLSNRPLWSQLIVKQPTLIAIKCLWNCGFKPLNQMLYILRDNIFVLCWVLIKLILQNIFLFQYHLMI